jgi:TPP-dependent indolepyruvate ferredoxin oxidoreductase alpha subunit
MVYKTLTESSSKAKAFAKIAELASKMKWNLIRSVFDEAAQRNVKSTPAGQQRAKDRRSRPPTFLCILCPGRFTTNNNLQSAFIVID